MKSLLCGYSFSEDRSLKHSLRRSLRRAMTHFTLGGALLLGCRGAVRPPDAIQQIEAAANTKGSVDFQVIGEPIDVADPMDATLTIDEAIRRTLQHDPQLQISLAKVRSALADANQARLLPNPVLSVALRFPSGGNGKPTIETGLTADLLSILQQPRRTSAADHRLRAASADALTAALNAIAEVQEVYVAAQSLDAQLKILNDRLALVRQLRDLANDRLAAGEAAQLDVLTLDTQRVGIEADMLERRGELLDARLRLARLIAQPSSSAAWKLSPWTTPRSNSSSESQWIAIALQHRPEIHSSSWELAALGDDVSLARVGSFDGLSVGADAERDGQWSVGPAINAPIPLMDFGQERFAKAEANRIEARHRFTQIRRRIVEDVRRAIAAFTAANQAAAKVRDELIPLQERRREQAEAQYKNGFADVTAVLLAENDSKEAQINLIALQQKVSLARLRLERAVGGPAFMELAAQQAASTQPTTQAEK